MKLEFVVKHDVHFRLSLFSANEHLGETAIRFLRRPNSTQSKYYPKNRANNVHIYSTILILPTVGATHWKPKYSTAHRQIASMARWRRWCVCMGRTFVLWHQKYKKVDGRK